MLFFSPSTLQATARRFIDGFPGMVTYAVKSNPEEVVIENLAAAGIRGYDVASPHEIRMIRRIAPDAALHYNNPVRSRSEIGVGVEMGVKSWSVDSASELAKLIELVPAEGCEIAVRFKLAVSGAAYNFGGQVRRDGRARGRAAAPGGRGGLHPVDDLPPGYAMHRPRRVGNLHPHCRRDCARRRRDHRAAERGRGLPLAPAERGRTRARGHLPP